MVRPLRVFLCMALVVFGSTRVDVQSTRIDGGRLLQALETLAADDMEGRLPGTPGSAKARAFLVQRFKEAGIQPIGGTFERPFTFLAGRGTSERTGVNIVGIVPGQREPARYIVVTAHYDHLGVRNGDVFNGADDNASGVAALLAVAARMSAEKPQHSIVFAALDAEESGLNGAKAFLNDPPVPREAIALNVNLDMVARDADNVLFAVGTFQYPFLTAYLKDVAQPPVKLRFGHDGTNPKEDDWTRDSDHYPFHQAGIPFVYFGVEDEAQHHKPTDDAATVTKEFFVGAANTILASLRKLDENLESIMKRR